VFPHAGDKFIGAPGAVVDGAHENRYAFSGDAPDVTISFLTVQNFGSPGQTNNEGVVNHDSAKGWKLESSTIQKNAGAGLMFGSDNRVIGNCLRDNGQYGFNAYHPDGVRDVVLQGNEISGNNTDDWEKREPGCGCTGGGKFWATNGAQVTDNYVHDNLGAGLWADSNNVGFRFEGNYISGNHGEGIMYETSYNAVILNNTLVRNALVSGPRNPGFPAAAIYLSESGSDTRVEGRYGDEFRISGNVFIDNWSGIVAWENADRFAGSRLVARSRRSRRRRSTTTAGGRRRTSLWKATPSRPIRRTSLAASPRQAVASTGSSRTMAPIHAGRRTRLMSCKRTSPSNRTMCGGTTATPEAGISSSRRWGRRSPGKRGGRRLTVRTLAAVWADRGYAKGHDPITSPALPDMRGFRPVYFGFGRHGGIAEHRASLGGTSR
jgi:Right handed beta helix region